MQTVIGVVVMTLTVKTQIAHLITVRILLVLVLQVVMVVAKDFVGMTVKISVT
jgi:hypothetical protein